MSNPVNVYLDQRRVEVPAFVGSYLSLRSVLGVPDGSVVALVQSAGFVFLGQDDEDIAGRNVRAWDFHEGDCYKTFALDVVRELFPELPGDGQDPADWWKERS